jgi:hypothetical protein
MLGSLVTAARSLVGTNPVKTFSQPALHLNDLPLLLQYEITMEPMTTITAASYVELKMVLPNRQSINIQPLKAFWEAASISTGWSLNLKARMMPTLIPGNMRLKWKGLGILGYQRK